MSKKKLPKKPSTLIRHALKDLGEVMRLKKYSIDMGSWHDPEQFDDNDKPKVCAVCFAGSVMARSLGAKFGESAEPCDYDDATSGKLQALNAFRTGDVYEGLSLMDLSLNKIERAEDKGLKFKMTVPEYTSGGGSKYTKFKKAMRKMAKHLESVGL